MGPRRRGASLQRSQEGVWGAVNPEAVQAPFRPAAARLSRQRRDVVDVVARDRVKVHRLLLVVPVRGGGTT